MKLFKISTSGWEIYGQHIFIHDKKTKEEFEEDCKKSIKKTLKKLIKNLDKKDIHLNAFDLMTKSIEEILKLGYEEIEYEGCYNIPGDDGSYISNEEFEPTEKLELGDELKEFIKKAKIYEN